jgi:hypothetical protein
MVLEKIAAWRVKREQKAIAQLRHRRERLEQKAQRHKALQYEQKRIEKAKATIGKSKGSGTLSKVSSGLRDVATEVSKNYESNQGKKSKSMDLGFDVPSYGGFGEPTRRSSRRRRPRSQPRRSKGKRKNTRRRRTRRQPTNSWDDWGW